MDLDGGICCRVGKNVALRSLCIYFKDIDSPKIGQRDRLHFLVRSRAVERMRIGRTKVETHDPASFRRGLLERYHIGQIIERYVRFEGGEIFGLGLQCIHGRLRKAPRREHGEYSDICAHINDAFCIRDVRETVDIARRYIQYACEIRREWVADQYFRARAEVRYPLDGTDAVEREHERPPVAYGAHPLNDIEKSLHSDISRIMYRMKEYTSGTLFKKYWAWFAEPHDVAAVAVANFFSYAAIDAPGFKRSEGVTSVIDLSQPLADIWEHMRKKFIREQIERGKRRGLTAAQSDAFEAFDSMYGRFTRQSDFDGLSPRDLRRGILFLARHEGRVIAGGVFIADGAHIRALALASRRLDEKDGRMRDLIGEANRLVIWEAIEYAKNAGYTLFDAGGIAPDSKDAHWRAVAEFKEGFGGRRIPQYYYSRTYSSLLTFLRRAKRVVLGG